MIEGADYWAGRSLEDLRRDWRNGFGNWIDEYWESRSHPHRGLIISEIDKLKPESVLEIGCNCGPNLSLIKEKLSVNKLLGIDINGYAIAKARQMLPDVDFEIGNLENLSLPDKSFDVVLADAVLMYVDSGSIYKVLNKLGRIAKKGIIICDWYDSSPLGVIGDNHWTRNYESLLKDFGFKVEKIKLTEKEWPNTSWMKHGYVFASRRV